jgi:pimeloyl-ACP methyl ester carboxylesterase
MAASLPLGKRIMKKSTIFKTWVSLSLFLCLMFNFSENFAMQTIQDISLYSESYGDIKNPAILLSAGAGNQAILWPEQFCRDLAQKGYFVIRYDYRDSGLSSAIDYAVHPYTIMDLTADTTRILEKYGVNKAHYVGFSMGGQISQFAAAYYPKQVLSLALLATSTDFKPGLAALEGELKINSLSPPAAEYLKWATRKVDPSNQTLEEKINDYVLTWKLLDGSPKDFDENFYKQQANENFTRSKLQEPYINHAKAMKASAELHRTVPGLIKVPTLIIHGAEDPVFGMDHGQDLHTKIINSKLVIWHSFAHAISPRNFARIILEIDNFIRNEKTSNSHTQ